MSPEKALRLTPADAFKELEIKCLRGNFVKATNKNDLLGHAIKNAPGRGHLAQPSLPSAAPEPAGSDARGAPLASGCPSSGHSIPLPVRHRD